MPASRTARLGLLTALALGTLVACGGAGGDARTALPDAPAATTAPAGTGGTNPSGVLATTPVPTGPPSAAVVRVASVEQPLALAPRPGEPDVLYVAERAGVIRRLHRQEGTERLRVGDPVLDVTGETASDSERGLLGLVFSADGTEAYVSRNDLDGNTRIEAYPVRGDDFDVAARRDLLFVEQPFGNHNGGHLALGPDGALWLGLGDGGSQGDPDNRAQDPDDLLGKLLRVPTDGGDAEIVASGLRNPWRFSFDTDGTLWLADVGQSEWEEINAVPLERVEGANFGWSGWEGTHRYEEAPERTPADPIFPVHEYDHSEGRCSVTGGLVYRGTGVPALVGSYVFADWCAGRLEALRPSADGVEHFDLAQDLANPTSFAADERGEIYVLLGDGDIALLTSAA